MSALAAGNENGVLLSGSWDKTAIIWKIHSFSEHSSIKLEGHGKNKLVPIFKLCFFLFCQRCVCFLNNLPENSNRQRLLSGLFVRSNRESLSPDRPIKALFIGIIAEKS